MRALMLCLAASAAACASAPEQGPRARIAEGLELTLPAPPGYPGHRTLSQTARARYGLLTGAFQSVVSLSPTQVDIVVTAAIGPRIATIRWDKSGVHEERTMLAPQGVPVENMLADLFIAHWPPEAIVAALPDGVELSVDETGGRTLSADGIVIMEVRRESETRTIIRNAALGYEISIISQVLE
jgi:Protein of unknown function (DUF3261)